MRVPTGIVSASRRASAKKHASYPHTCGDCGKVARGNGGWSSHKRHCRARLQRVIVERFEQGCSAAR
jgi:hypothetical protein